MEMEILARTLLLIHVMVPNYEAINVSTNRLADQNPDQSLMSDDTDAVPFNTTQINDDTDAVPFNTTQISDHTDTVPFNTKQISDHTDAVSFNTTQITDHTDAVSLNTTQISDHTDAVPFNTTQISDHTDAVPFNTTQISDHTDAVPFNTTQISDHTDAVPFNTTQISDHTDAVPFNTTQISDDTDAVPFNTTQISDHTDAVQFNTKQISDHTDAVPFNTTQMSDYTDAVSFNTTHISDHTDAVPFNTTQISDYTDAVSFNTTQITDHTDAVPFNTTQITDHTDAVPFNTTQIADHTDAVSFNTTQISNNTDAVSFNTTQISDHTDAVSFNTTQITDHTDAIPFNTIQISNDTDAVPFNTTQITDHTDAAPFNTTQITDHTDAIPFNTIQISNNTDAVPFKTAQTTDHTDAAPFNTTQITDHTDAVSFNITQISDHTDAVNWTDIAERHCSYYNSCSHTAASNAQEQNTPVTGSCCQPCECSNLCRTGNCCPGIPRITDTVEIECKDQIQLFNARRRLQDVNIDHYYIIDTCDQSYNDSAIIRSCDHPVDLLDHVLVIHPANQRVYKNAKCAECNYITDYVYWTLVAVANDVTLLGLDYMELTERILTDAALFSRPPASVDRYIIDINRCFPGTVSSCNQTGLWEVYDAVLETACSQSPSTAYYGKFIYFDTVYSNVYCYLCNQPSEKELHNSNACPPVREFTFHTLTDENDLRIEINGAVASRILMDDFTNKTCGADQIFDEFMLVCRKLICPLESVAVFGVCDTRAIGTEGLAIEFTINLTSSKPHGIQTTIGRKYYRDLFENTVSEYGLEFKGSNCVICDQIFYMLNGESPSLFLQMSSVTGSNCTAADITSALVTVSGRGHLSFNHISENRTQLFFKASAARPCSTNHRVQIHPRFYCPSIPITVNDTDEIGRNHGYKVSERILKLAARVSNASVYEYPFLNDSYSLTSFWIICVDEYNKVFESLADTNGLTYTGGCCWIVTFGILTVVTNV